MVGGGDVIGCRGDVADQVDVYLLGGIPLLLSLLLVDLLPLLLQDLNNKIYLFSFKTTLVLKLYFKSNSL